MNNSVPGDTNQPQLRVLYFQAYMYSIRLSESMSSPYAHVITYIIVHYQRVNHDFIRVGAVFSSIHIFSPARSLIWAKNKYTLRIISPFSSIFLFAVAHLRVEPLSLEVLYKDVKMQNMSASDYVIIIGFDFMLRSPQVSTSTRAV